MDELRGLLKRMQREALQRQIEAAVEAMKTDPSAAQTYRELMAQLKALGL